MNQNKMMFKIDNISNNIKKSIQIITTFLIISLIYSSGCLFDNNNNNKIKYSGKLLINEIYLNGCNSSNTLFNSDDDSWLEIYNPNNYSIDVSKYHFHYDLVQEPPSFPEISIKCHGYIIFCKNIYAFRNNFNIPINGNVYEYEFAFDYNVFGVWNEYELTGYEDYVEIKSDIPEDHSMARYQNGFDTDNITNDFYFDSNPTPGRENNEVKS